jgi:GTPase SAR1 family protein
MSIIGSAGVGKTALFLRVSRGVYDGQHEPTIGSSCWLLELARAEGRITIPWWDIPSKDMLLTETSVTLSGSQVINICFALDDRASVDAVSQ